MSNKISRRTFLKCTGASAAALGAAAMLGGCGSSTSNAIEVKSATRSATGTIWASSSPASLPWPTPPTCPITSMSLCSSPL